MKQTKITSKSIILFLALFGVFLFFSTNFCMYSEHLDMIFVLLIVAGDVNEDACIYLCSHQMHMVCVRATGW